jgi:Alkyl sulfatase C-terminal
VNGPDADFTLSLTRETWGSLYLNQAAVTELAGSGGLTITGDAGSCDRILDLLDAFAHPQHPHPPDRPRGGAARACPGHRVSLEVDGAPGGPPNAESCCSELRGAGNRRSWGRLSSVTLTPSARSHRA